VTDSVPATPRSDGLPSRDGPAPLAADAIAPLDLARLVVEAAEDKKAADIVLLDVTALTTLADCFVICSGGSERQLAAIADSAVDAAREAGVRPYAREGAALSHWLLVDFGSVVLHVFAPPERDFYQLERLWAEAKTILRVQ
jgi:ribosome-associated protein